MAETLKPCPFCGSDKVRVKRRQGASIIGTPYCREQVVCLGCDAHSGIAKRPGRSVAKWNRRAALAGVCQSYMDMVKVAPEPPAATPDAINALVDALRECRNALWADNPADGWKEIIDQADAALSAFEQEGRS